MPAWSVSRPLLQLPLCRISSRALVFVFVRASRVRGAGGCPWPEAPSGRPLNWLASRGEPQLYLIQALLLLQEFEHCAMREGCQKRAMRSQERDGGY